MSRLLLADDHPMIRSGLKVLIEQYISQSTIDEAHDGDSAFEKIKHNDYDLVIMDVNMPNTDSFGLLSNIFCIKPDIKVLMFSINAEEPYAKRYLKLGAMGYLKKNETQDEIKKAITAVLNNKRYISPALREKLFDDFTGNNNHENPFDKLSPREFEIVQHLSRGESLSDICQKLTLHASTVGTHKARIFEKLQCNNIIELSALARLHKIIPDA